MFKPFRRLAAVLLFLGLVFAAAQASGLREHMTLQYVHAQFEAHLVQGVLLFTLLFCVGNLIQIPGLVFLGAAVLALGKLEGGLLTYAAAVVSCVVTFLLIRLLGGDALRQFRSAWARRAMQRLDTRPVLIVVLLRSVMATVPALNYALALSGIRFRQYLWGTLLGLPLPIAFYSLLFETVARLSHLPVL